MLNDLRKKEKLPYKKAKFIDKEGNINPDTSEQSEI